MAEVKRATATHIAGIQDSLDLGRNIVGWGLERDIEMMDVLDVDEKMWLFMFLWRDNDGLCGTCGADEGGCDPSACVRTRVTHKLRLVDLRSPLTRKRFV